MGSPRGSQEAPRSPLEAPSVRVKLIHIRCRFVDFFCSCAPPTLGGPDDHILDIPPGGLKSSQMGHRRPQEAQEGPRRPQDASRRPPSERDKLHIQCRFVVFSALVAMQTMTKNTIFSQSQPYSTPLFTQSPGGP